VSQAEDVGEVFQVFMVVGKPLTAHGRLIETKFLSLRSHRSVEQQYPLGQQ
jgi:hypothetical protein